MTDNFRINLKQIKCKKCHRRFNDDGYQKLCDRCILV